MFDIKLETALGNTEKTTDKMKVYVGNTQITLDEKKVEADKGATVKAKFNPKTMKLTLTAGKDAEATAVVSIAFINSVTKDVKLIRLMSVDAAGNVNLR